MSGKQCWSVLPGLYKEFFVAFFGELGKLLVSVFNYAFEVGELSSSQKKDRDHMLIKNWRPISLINVDMNPLRPPSHSSGFH